jgi:Zn-dependent protease
MTDASRRRSSWRIAQVAGIDIRIHPTFLVLVGLAMAGWFGEVGAGLLWLLVVFGSVLLHELAHSLVARRRGIPVRDILLLPIGGVSEMERLPDRPKDELAVSAAGPATSLLTAATAAAVAWSTGVEVLPVDLVQGPVVHRILWANVMLGGFNLLPAFPLDGGRVLRAVLARRQGLERATRTAAAVGRVLAIAMGIIGLVGNLWLLLIAVFTYIGGRAEEAATVLHLRLGPRTVADVMVPADAVQIHPALVPMSVARDLDLETALEQLTNAQAAAAAVTDPAGVIVGILRVEDIAHLLS